MTLSLFFYDALLLMGLVISYEDWRERKIRNRWIVAGLLLCAGGYLYLLANSVLGYSKLRWMGLGEYYLPWNFYLLVAGHVLLVIMTGIVSWWMGLWPAGDAKLYIVFGILIVLIDQNVRGFPYIVFLKLLINIFVPAGLWILATVLLGAVKSLPKVDFSNPRRRVEGLLDRAWKRGRDIWPYRYGFTVYLLNIFLLFFALDLLEGRFAELSFLKNAWGKIVVLLLMYVLWTPVSRLLKGKRFWRTWLLIAAWWVFDPVLRQTNMAAAVADTMETVIMFGVILTFLRSAVTLFLRWESTENIDAKDLRPGMILSEKAWETMQEFGRERRENFPRRYADGLFPEDVERLQEWKIPDAVVTVYRATPFAFWVFYGTLITLVLPKNAVYWLFRILYDPSGAVYSFLRLWGIGSG
ncbi:MAG: hypothetical protein ABIJ96_13080 [Elusimicrobiota bacterium]